ncbi:MAG: hypothetical protein QOG68_2079 [Solirubrobacteraceae bacterium]|nr:hypothetical protein [Solirubrobacteraceae bacterium]
MKIRALCATGLVALALPAVASAGSSISNRLHRADHALGKAQDAADAGDDAGVVSGLKGANRQTSLALKAALRRVVADRDNADVTLADVTDQFDSNAQTALDMLDGASPAVVGAINATLAATDLGRGQVLTTVQGLGDLEPDWGDSLTQIADDAVSEVSTASDNYDGSTLSAGAMATLTAFVAHETDAAGAIVAEVASIGGNPDALLDVDMLDGLEGTVADAADALGSVTGLDGANAAAVSDAAAKLVTLDGVVTSMVDALGGVDYGYDDSGDTYDDSGASYDTGYADGYADALDGWGWAPRGHGYHGWNDSGYGG